MSPPISKIDALDVELIALARAHPRAGALELSRLARVARATVTARLERLEQAGVITGYGPEIDLGAAGFPVQAFVSLEIAQGAIDAVRAELDAIPGVLEAHATTGTADVFCRVAAASHEDLHATLLRIGRSGSVIRSTSVVVLSEVVAPRVLPLLRAHPRPSPSRAPAFRAGAPST
ncbi:Lrp/AsnC family transcriptional regulator [Pseudonocardia asaccharolytica]|uniref:Putative transcriptional regulator, AsnC family protein n=1 Tax=Pseudonocardia asaccharolytica DSM 44247 = NBRC 16224 TaxID=1123024 RepID=A0A511CZT8_9PSEU|nr:Lrp/AsnC family transcriptional regulator [Pseudonocardia asaccharolytica]GEL18062.1 putative transcriptional regulator, AsnC family protein [Pseudonocardia asaccharolytica DSM 44247 = NBRC 16224]